MLNAEALLELVEQASRCGGPAEHRFVLLNETRDHCPYRVAVLWEGPRLSGHSGAGQVEALGPYAQWLERLRSALTAQPAGVVNRSVLPAPVAAEWLDWWPDHALWLPMAGPEDDDGGGLVFARDTAWTDTDQHDLQRWFMLWQRQPRANAAVRAPSWGSAVRGLAMRPRRTVLLAAIAVLSILLWPVHLTVRAPAEIVPREPLVLRATVDGAVRQIKVQPNQPVKAGEVLAELDDAGWASRLQVARQGLATAEAEWRQVQQQALNDPRAKALLAGAQGKYEERHADVTYLEQQVRRNVVVAPRDGVVLLQDPGSWSGRTVTAGEALMKLAQPQDQEVEAWLAVGDAVDLQPGAPMRVHLTSHPGAPLHATLRWYAYEAENRPELGWGYRLRGTLSAAGMERLGARGTARIDGARVPLVYWVLRRPLATLGEITGW